MAALVMAAVAFTLVSRPIEAGSPITGYPNAMAATGDSITRAHQTCPVPGTDCPANSWSTGTNSAVDSQYLRILAANALINGNNFNDAVSGAKMAALNSQVQAAVSQHVSYITILMGANDVCTSSAATMTDVATYASQFQTAMDTLTAGLPDARIFVASIPDIYKLWQILHTNPTAATVWTNYGICQSMLANPTSMAQTDVDRRAFVRQRNIDFNTQLQQICAQYIHCRSDNNAVFNTAFAPADVSTVDYFHPSVAGQALGASVSWGATFDFTDTTPPVVTAVAVPAPGGITVTLSATDNVGVSGIEYNSNGGPWIRYTAPAFVPTGSSITFRAVDVNGNSGATQLITAANAVGGIADVPDLAALPSHAPGSGSERFIVLGTVITSLFALSLGGLWLLRRRPA
ncbi:MAG: hypothetical protein KGK07_07775 [Chloroflexota bacterium]|nr:hypothetical protein [Chloroflexota bacterium]